MHVQRRNSEWTTDGYFVHLTEHAVGIDGLLDLRHYQMIVFTFSIERSSTFFKYLLVAPSVLLAVLTLCLYWIPVQSGERFTLGRLVHIPHPTHISVSSHGPLF